MTLKLRQILMVILVPGTVAGLLPYLLLRRYGGLPSQYAGLLAVAGGLLLAAGLGMLLWCVWLFARVGRGTLAPWDPTRELVAAGPYAYVRNPMISGVIAALVGEALLFRSPAIGWLALGGFVLNHFYFIYSEEPGLEARFGAAYRDYKARVPRWIPKFGK
jgi:protein-S-isoprenylcysteine O-methyltransferase Ste14